MLHWVQCQQRYESAGGLVANTVLRGARHFAGIHRANRSGCICRLGGSGCAWCLTLVLSMRPIKFALISLATYGILGPLVPTVLLASPSLFVGHEGMAVFGLLFVPTAYLLGGPMALACGVVFTVLVLVASRVPKTWPTASTSTCLFAGIAAGAAAALPWLIAQPILLWVQFFLAPSLVCGAILGASILPRLIAHSLLSSRAK